MRRQHSTGQLVSASCFRRNESRRVPSKSSEKEETKAGEALQYLAIDKSLRVDDGHNLSSNQARTGRENKAQTILAMNAVIVEGLAV